MKRFLLPIVAASLLTGCANDNLGDISTELSHSSKIRNWSDDAVAGRLLVALADGDTEFTVEGLSLEVEPLFPGTKSDKMSRWQLVHFDKSLDLMSVAERIAESSSVEFVEFDLPVKRIKSESLPMPEHRPAPTRSETYPFNDPELPFQWHYHNTGALPDGYDVDPRYCLAGADINLFNAWKYTTGDNRIIVAVMDGGIMVDHDDLKDNMWINEAEYNGQMGIDDDMNGYVDDIHGYNFVRDNGKITADNHGTHVAGTISAVNNNEFCGCGIAGGTGRGDGVRLMSLQIFEGDESCYHHQIARGFTYAADNGAVLINNSWGYDPGSVISDNQFEASDSMLKEAIDYFEANARLDGVIEGGLAIFAAGNETYHAAAYPGAYYKYICVSAMASDFTAAYYTNYGPGCNISAPGGDALYGTLLTISSTSPDMTKYEYMQGTSMATPHVTGCAALALSYAINKGYSLTNEQLRNLILTSTHDINAYQTGTKMFYDFDLGEYYEVPLDSYQKKLGSGYIDAHLLLMQLDSTPCLYFKTGTATLLSLDEYFGDGSEDLTYQGCEVSDEVLDALGMQDKPRIENGMLSIQCNKPGSGRIKVKAIIGGQTVGGGDLMGGMVVEREFELVVRGSVADNGGWL